MLRVLPLSWHGDTSADAVSSESAPQTQAHGRWSPEKRRFPCTAGGAVNVCHVRCDTGCPIWERFAPLQGSGKSKGLHGLEPWAFETCGEEAAGLGSVMEGWRFSYAICRRMPVAERGERRRIVPHDV